MYENEINAYFDDPARREELIGHITRLVAVRSVREDAQPGMPFGPGPLAALKEGLALSAEMGFTAASYDNYVGTVDLNDKETALHILAHLDVVGEGTGWKITEPYQAKVVDGLIFGRGTSDDKGPAVTALMAMEAIKNLGIPLKKNVRLILGTDEESGSDDLAYYYGREPFAPYTFTPDAEFPLINIEKGFYRPTFHRSWAASDALPRVKELHGGFRTNVLPPEAEALVAGMTAENVQPYLDAAVKATGTSYDLKDEADGVRIYCHGVGSHASLPEEGNNAITGLLTLLCALPLADTDSTAALHDLSALFPHGDCVGKALGIAQSDEESGALSLAFSLLEVTETGLDGQFDSRVPISANDENCRKVAEAAFASKGMKAEGEMIEPHHTPADSPLVKTLLGCYEQYSGRKGQCMAIGGGTYVHEIPGGVAFGCEMPGFNSNMHGADERASVDDLMTSCKIFALAIARLCG